METLQISNDAIAYDVRGQGSADSAMGETIVMLPAGAHQHGDFDELRALLSQRFRTIAIDWPGHGGSPADGGYSAMRFADIAEEVVAQMAPQGAIVLGNSVGGFAATRLAIRRPELVRGLTVVDGGGFAGRPPQARLFCALMARPWFLRRIYPSFSKQYMRPRSDADRRARAAAIATTRGEPVPFAEAAFAVAPASPAAAVRPDAIGAGRP